MRGRREEERDQRIAIHVGVVGEHAGGGHEERRVFRRGEGIVDRHRPVVDRSHSDGDRGQAAVGRAVIRHISETVAAIVIRVRQVGERAVGVQGQRAIGRRRHQDRGQRIVFHVGIIHEYTGRGYDERRVFRRGVAVGVRHRRVIHAGDGQRDRRRSRAGQPVVGPVGEAVGAVGIRGRDVDERAVRV